MLFEKKMLNLSWAACFNECWPWTAVIVCSVKGMYWDCCCLVAWGPSQLATDQTYFLFYQMLRALENSVSFKPIKINHFCFQRGEIAQWLILVCTTMSLSFCAGNQLGPSPGGWRAHCWQVLHKTPLQKCHNIILQVWWCHCKENERLPLSVSVGLTIAMSYMTEILNSQSMKVSSG